VNCASCGFANAAAARFCAGCGKPLEDATAVPEVGERRQLTVLMCDMVGSTALSQALDSEDLRAMLTDYRRVCSEVVEREEGHIAQYLGDGVVIYFGFPHAHEDDAQRAVRCGLEILNRIQQLDVSTTWPSGAKLQVRIGADTGRVVVGGFGPQQHYLVHGEAPNIAARAQSVGDPGSLVVSEATWRLVQGYFRAESLGEVALKGIEEPMRLWRVTGTSGAASRLEMGGVLTEYVGRQREHAALEAEWKTVTSGAARFVTVRGEAGIGKSRLVREFTQKLAGPSVDRLDLRFTPYSRNSAFLPVVELLEGRLGFDATLSREARLDRIDGRMVELGITAADAAPLLAELLSVPTDGRYPPLVISPIRRRQRTLEVLVAAVRALASQRPTVLVAEDLHWADPSTLEMLGLLVASASGLPLLALCTARPEFEPAWSGASARLIEVAPLDGAEVEAVAHAVARSKTMPGEVMREIAMRCDGVPLFVEEVTHAVIESGALEEREHTWELIGPLPPGLVPDSVEASLTARLDRLGDSRATAQLAATIGREFTYALLRAVSDRSEDALGGDLQNLIDAGLAWHLSSADAEKFVFKHALIQEAAYESLLRKNRQLFHRRIAAALQQQFPEVADEQPELIAQHLTDAGDYRQAIVFWEAAGRRAVEGTAWHEAAAHFRHAIECVSRLPEDPCWLERELDLQNAVTPVLMSVHGPGSSHVRDACVRAHDLARRLGHDDKIFPSLAGFWYNHFLRGEMDEADVAARDALSFAEASGTSMLQLTARRMTGYTHLERGEFEEALLEAEAGLALFDPEREPEMVATFGNSMTASLHIVRATALWMLGQGDEAARERAMTIRFARDLDHVAVLAQALASWLHMSLCFEWYTLEVDEVVSVANELRALSEDDFVMWHAVGTVYRGVAAAVQDDAPLADGLMRDGLAEFAGTRSRLTLVAMNVLCARARILLGEADAASRHLGQAQIEADTRNERMWEPEIDRMRASLELRRGDLAGAEASLRRALAKANRQKARSLELRAALDLHEFLADCGRNAEGHALVEGLVSTFDPGSVQPEVRRALALGLAAR
jgi:class 3 adenylate cyclase/tetratricopeptide (TPR) repeat protein